jgi:exonuclease SbcC
LQLLKEKLQIESERKIGLAREVNNLDLEVRESSKQKEAVTLERKVIEEKVKKARELESDLAREKALLIGKRELEVKLSRDMVVMQREISDPADFSVDRLNAVSELLIKHKGVLDEKRKMYMDINLAITRIESQKEAPFTLKQKIMSMDNCPTCQQIVSSEHKEKIDKRTGFEIDELSHSLEHKIVERNQLSTDIEKVSDLISGYESDLRNLREAQMKFEQQKNVKIKLQSEAFTLDRTKQEILQLEARVTELVSQELSEEDKIKSTEVIAREDALNKKLRLHEITFAEKQRELKLVRERLEELNIEVTKKEKVKLQIVYLRNLQDWVNEKFLSVIMLTEKNVLSKLRMEFSNVFTEWFSLLVSDDLSVRLDEDFTPIIMQQDYEIEYAFLSGGERTAVALSYRLSLHQVLNSMLSRLKTKNLLILDEPTDGFAAEQIDKMRDLFDALDTEQLILVSHEQKMEGFVDRIIRVSKGESSRLEEVSG